MHKNEPKIKKYKKIKKRWYVGNISPNITKYKKSNKKFIKMPFQNDINRVLLSTLYFYT